MRLQILTILIGLILSACYEVPNNADRKKQEPNRPAATGGEAEDDLSPYLRSHAFRTKNTNQYTIDGIRKYIAANGSYPRTFHPIPNDRLTTDQERESTPYSRRQTNCGILADDNAPSISKRMADCKNVYKDDLDGYLWNGKVKGIAGEGKWQLVMKKGNRHIWLDLSTNLLWTDLVTEATWENASGSQVNEADAICTNAYLSADAASSDTDFFMGLTAEEVSLRLPTRNDFLQADLNGARFVLSNVENKTYWTANYSSDDNMAWAIMQKDGILTKMTPSTLNSVRCLGVIIK
jgi:hypothetical protein